MLLSGVCMVACAGADASARQLVPDLPSVEINLQALQQLEQTMRFRGTVQRPQEVVPGSIQSQKVYPPGYTPPVKRAAPKPAPSEPAPTWAKAPEKTAEKSVAKAAPVPKQMPQVKPMPTERKIPKQNQEVLETKAPPPQPKSATANDVLNDLMNMPATPDGGDADLGLPPLPKQPKNPPVIAVAPAPATSDGIAEAPKRIPELQPDDAKEALQAKIPEIEEPLLEPPLSNIPPIEPAPTPVIPRVVEPPIIGEFVPEQETPTEDSSPFIKTESKVTKKVVTADGDITDEQAIEALLNESGLESAATELPAPPPLAMEEAPLDQGLEETISMEAPALNVEPAVPSAVKGESKIEEIGVPELPQIAMLEQAAPTPPADDVSAPSVPMPDIAPPQPTPDEVLFPEMPDVPAEVNSAPATQEPSLPSLSALTGEPDPIDSRAPVVAEVPSEPVVSEVLSSEVGLPPLPVEHTPQPEAPLPETMTAPVPAFEPQSVVAETPEPAVAEITTPVPDITPEPTPAAPTPVAAMPDLPVPPAPPGSFDLAALPTLPGEGGTNAPEPAAALTTPPDAQIVFTKGEKTVSDALEQRVIQIAEQAKANDNTVQVIAYASSESEEPSSVASRLSLARALDIRTILIQNGVNEDRISLQALGNKVKNSEDRADIFLK